MTQFHCPFCDYENDSRSGVEAHISGKSDSSHEGKVGRSYRSKIEQASEPDGFVGRLQKRLGESAQVASVLEEVRNYRDAHREDVEELRQENEKLRERVNELEDRMPSTRDLHQRQAILPALVADVRNLSALVAERVEGGEEVCPNCGVKASLSATKAADGLDWAVRCRNCRGIIAAETERAVTISSDVTRGFHGDGDFWREAEDDDWLGSM
jgi:transcription elongation factor Elf1